MAINETSVDGKKYRQKTESGWKWYSFITKAKDILFGDGEDADNNLETNLGSFKGITTSTNVTEAGYAADATVVSELNRSLGVDIKLIDGTPHWSERGADSFSPFKTSTQSIEYTYIQDSEGKIPELTYDYDCDTVSVIAIDGSRSRTLWTKSNPTTCYVHVTGSQFTYTTAVVTLDTENKKITFSGIGYSYGKNNGDPSHTIYICP